MPPKTAELPRRDHGTQEHVDAECTQRWLLCGHRPYRGLATQSGLLVLQSLLGFTHVQARFASSQRQICPEEQPPTQSASHMTGMVVVVVIGPVALTTRITKVSASASMPLASPLVRQPRRRSAFEKALSNRRCCFARRHSRRRPSSRRRQNTRGCRVLPFPQRSAWRRHNGRPCPRPMRLQTAIRAPRGC